MYSYMDDIGLIILQIVLNQNEIVNGLNNIACCHGKTMEILITVIFFAAAVDQISN